MLDLHYFESTLPLAGTKMPCRSVAVKGPQSLILIAPIRFNEEQIKTLKSLGEVTDIVAPCLFHHLSIPLAIELFPKARVWGVRGFKKKRPDIAWTEELSEKNWPYGDFLEILTVRGIPATNEAEFFHKPSRTLIATDICFNLKKPQGWSSPLFFRIMGTYNRFAVSRLFKFAVKDQEAFKNSLDELFKWDFDRIVMNHGDIVETDGKIKLKSALLERGFVIC